MQDLDVIHNSQESQYRRPFGAVVSGEKVRLSIDVNKEVQVSLKIIKMNGIINTIIADKQYLNNGFFKYSAEIDTLGYKVLF